MKILTTACCDKLVTQATVDKFREKYSTNFDGTEFEYLSLDNGLTFPDDFELDPNDDAKSSILFFSALDGLDRVQANDKRLWMTLTHTCFFEYTKERWKVDHSSSDDTIKDRFLFEGSSIQTRMRNAVSRLWWAAKLTQDINRADPFELTKILWSKQDIFQNLVERSYGTNDSVMKGFLEFYSKNNHLKERQLRTLFTSLNSAGGVQVLAAHNKEDVINTLSSISNYYGFKTAA